MENENFFETVYPDEHSISSEYAELCFEYDKEIMVISRMRNEMKKRNNSDVSKTVLCDHCTARLPRKYLKSITGEIHCPVCNNLLYVDELQKSLFEEALKLKSIKEKMSFLRKEA